MQFTFFNNIILIIKTTIHYIMYLQIITLIKFIFIIFIVIINMIINNLFLLMDNIFFNYQKIKINKPLFIIGFPRSGTTFLHKMLLKDTQFTTPQLWELIFAPSILQKKIYYYISDLFNENNFLNNFNSLFRPLTHSLDNIHEINLKNPEEDYLFLMPFGGCFLLTLIYPIDEIWNLYNFDKNFSKKMRHRLFKKYDSLIKRHLYFHGKNKIYLSKNPHFTSFSKSLKDYFQDCNLIGCHREPKKSIPSVMSSMEPGYKLMSRDIKNDTSYFIDMYKIYSKALIKNYNQNDSFILIEMSQTKNNLRSTIKEIYNTFKYKIDIIFLDKITKQSKKSKKFISQNNYSLKRYNLDSENFDKEYKEYYSFIKKL